MEYYVKDLAKDTNYNVYDFSENLKSYFYDIVLDGMSSDSLAYEYAEYGLEQIDFYELAETFLTNIEDEEDLDDEDY